MPRGYSKIGKKLIPPSRKGSKHSKKSKQQMSVSHLGKKLPHTENWNKKISEAKKGKHYPKLSKALMGEKHPNWKGGKDDESKMWRKRIEYRLWREAVFARDNWTCQKCGKRGKKLHPHHIFNFAKYPELRFAIDNGITFCEKHHRLFHKMYDSKNNTKEQLETFLMIIE